MCTCMHIHTYVRTYVFVVQIDNFGCVGCICVHICSKHQIGLMSFDYYLNAPLSFAYSCILTCVLLAKLRTYEHAPSHGLCMLGLCVCSCIRMFYT